MGDERRSEPILQVKNLSVRFGTDEGVIRAVDGVDIAVYPGETLGIVGESGSGKTVSALSVLGLLSKDSRTDIQGEILYGGRDLARLSNTEMQSIRGNEIAMIFQEPMTSLNPVYTIGYQLTEAIRAHFPHTSDKDGRAQAVELLRRVGIPEPDRRVDQFPHELSGGMRQRAMIAMALSCSPKVLLADEPTTALDVTIQAQILDLLNSLKERYGMAVVMITHDLGVIAETASRVVVMYAGRVVEEASAETLFEGPRHPYTDGLMSSIPEMNVGAARLSAIPGSVPDPANLPTGCKFAGRCPLADTKCWQEEPELFDIGEGRKTRCWYWQELLKRQSAPESRQVTT
jgi:peptide/nickel transport system ATP-binding protein/oligopeptide transport system ATP-binding protein